MDTNNGILLTILSKSDALFMPLRGDCFRRTPTWERRQLFADSGIEWPCVDRTPAGRQAARREAGKLQAGGDVQILGAASSKLRVRLTPAADDAMRFSIGLNDYAASLSWLDELYRLRADADGFDDGAFSWTSEAVLTGTAWGRDSERWRYVALSEAVMPVLHRGLVISNCSTQGHCWYSLTPTGLQLAEERAESGLAVETPMRADITDMELYVLYDDARRSEIERLGKVPKFDPREISPIPLPVHAPLRRFLSPMSTGAGGAVRHEPPQF